MTVAVCLACGRMKAGAWTPCPACGYRPTGAEELAQSLMVSDNCISSDKLEEFAARRQQGEPWNFDPQLVEMFKQRVAALIPMNSGGQVASAAVDPPSASPLLPAAESGKRERGRKRWWQFWR